MRTVFFSLTFLLFLAMSFFLFHRTFASPEKSSDFSMKGEVNGVSDEKALAALPLSFESRASAAQILPYKKPNVGGMFLPAAHASVALDVDSGMILHEYAAHDPRQIASLTKLMTAMLAVERIKNLDEAVVIPEEAVYAEGTRVGCPRSGFCNGNRLKVGEVISARNLLKAALMNSANDAAISLGMHMGGTQSGFVKIMNDRAAELGLKNTHFCTASGLEIDGREWECHSSAYDIARIAANALKYDVLWDIMRLPGTTIESFDGQHSHDIFNTDMLLDQYPDLLGAKTGFTPLAGYSLLAVATDPSKKHRVVSVVLNDPERWKDIRTLFAWVFDSFIWK